MRTDVLVIGGGLSGLCAALGAQKSGARTAVLASGMGVLYLSSGCIDLMAYPGGRGGEPVGSPLEAIAGIGNESPEHPYASIDDQDLRRALDSFVRACGRQDLHMAGDGTKNFRIPTALGTYRPTAIVPHTMVKGDLLDRAPMTLIGFLGFRDFFAELAAAEINIGFGIETRSVVFDPSSLMGGRTINTVSLGRAFEDLKFCEGLARFINREVGRDMRVGLPATLGVDGASMAHKSLEELTARPIFEIPILPPSLPGRRIYQALKREFFEQGGQLITGCPVLKADTENRRVKSIAYKAGEVGRKSIEAKAFVLATGSYFSGGLVCKRDSIVEPIFGLSIRDEPAVRDRYAPDFLAAKGHPIGKAGVRIAKDFRPCNQGREAVYENLFACGDVVGGFDSLLERSGGGVAVASGILAGEGAVKAAEK